MAVHCSGYFYSKQWLRSVNPHDRIVIRRGDYPIPSEWTPVFDRRHPVQTAFFEALYRLRVATGCRWAHCVASPERSPPRCDETAP